MAACALSTISVRSRWGDVSRPEVSREGTGSGRQRVGGKVETLAVQEACCRAHVAGERLGLHLPESEPHRLGHHRGRERIVVGGHGGPFGEQSVRAALEGTHETLVVVR